jgi:predicted alpha/beta superfamily hydrolase
MKSPITVLIILLLAGPRGLAASTHIETLHSKAAEGTYWLYIYQPDDYDTSGKRYPVVYLLDADLHFDRIVRTISENSGSDLASRIMIVGLGYGNEVNMRWRDYTPSRMADFPGSGGVSKYYRLFRRELIPRIDGGFRTIRRSGGRCIAGHSFGGIAALYGLLNHHDLFGGFIVISPSLWWDNELFFKKRMRFQGRRAMQPLKIYCGVGGLEDPSMDILAVKYLHELKNRRPGRFNCRYSIIDGRDHDDVVNEALAEGLEFIFP